MERVIDLVNLSAGYGSGNIISNINIHVVTGEIVSLMGRNGMGKSTTLKTILGLIRPVSGKCYVMGCDTQKLPTYKIAQLGIGYVPEARNVFPSLTVKENLIATSGNRLYKNKPWTLDKVLNLFPRLGERLNQNGNTLSGGEQQMLVIGRALMTNPKILILDEATEGLAPLVRTEIWSVLQYNLKESGQAILIVDRYPKAIAEVADRHYIIENGKNVWTGNSTDLLDKKLGLSDYLHLG